MTTTTTTPLVNALSLSIDAGEAMKAAGIAVVAVLIPLAVALLVVKWVIHQVQVMVFGEYAPTRYDTGSFGYRDEYWNKGEMYDPEDGRYVGMKEGRAYFRTAGQKRRKYDK